MRLAVMRSPCDCWGWGGGPSRARNVRRPTGSVRRCAASAIRAVWCGRDARRTRDATARNGAGRVPSVLRCSVGVGGERGPFLAALVCSVYGVLVARAALVAVVPNVCGDGFECGAHGLSSVGRGWHWAAQVRVRLLVSDGLHVAIPDVGAPCFVDEVVGDHRAFFLYRRTDASLMPVPRLFARQ